MSIRRTKVDQGAVIRNAGSNAKGVCLTLCRRWIKAQMTGRWEQDETVYDLSANDVIQDVLAEQARAGRMADHDIEGLDHNVSARRTGGGTRKFAGLRSRDDVIDHVLTTRGAFIYVATKKNGGGHAFAFDTRQANQLVFFDPNQGEWVAVDETNASLKQWWKEFWDASGQSQPGQNIVRGEINYKKAFHQGDRELWRYDLAL